MKFILPYHLGCGNRGCEGICRGISNIFNPLPEDLILYNMTYSEFLADKELGLGEFGDLRYKGSSMFECGRVLFKAIRKTGIKQPYNYFIAEHYLKDAKPGDVFLMTGGDIYCYNNGYILPNLLAKKARAKGITAVAYCASFEKKYLTPDVIKGLENYDLILTRETISADTLNELGIKNQLVPDPAFTLEPIPVKLPAFFSDKPVVGLNFSPYTNSSNVFSENIINLCKYCEEKGMNVCLIPHVFWKGQDDREAMKAILNKLGNNVHYLDCTQLSYLQIRYIISKCKYFIGGRTHSVISAYSTRVPCIALGYSVKSRGIAHDLGMPDYTVVDSKNLKSENDLLNAFIRLTEEEQIVINAYSNLDEYIKKSYEARNILDYC